MATYLLTTGDDKITGTSGADTFDGWIDGKTGGIDTLDGGGGNDTFKLSGNGGGVIDGGAGTDILVLGREGLGTQTFKNVEIVDVSKSYSFSGSVSQLNSFDQIVSKNSGGYIRVNVVGEGGSLDFSSKVSEGYSIRLHFDVQSPATSGISVVATANDDFLDGTDFDDVLSGGGGNDTIRSAEGSDVLNGGDGNDILTAGVGFGTDTLNGGEGDDLISNGGQSGSILYGDAGNDTFKIGGLINIIDGGNRNRYYPHRR